MKYLYLLCSLVYLVNTSKGQGYAYIEVNTFKDHIFNLSDHTLLFNTDFYFPYDGGDKGLDIFKSLDFEVALKSSDSKQKLDLHIPVFYAENVQSFEIYYFDTNFNKHSVSTSIIENGYNKSIYATFEILYPKGTNPTIQLPNYLHINATKRNEWKDSKLIFSNISIGTNVKQEKLSPMPFFKDIFVLNRDSSNQELTKSFINTSSKTDWFCAEYNQSPIRIKGIETNNRLLYSLINQSVLDYPFYEEKQINRIKAQNELNSIWQKDSSKTQCELLLVLDKYLARTFRDGHFKLSSNCVSSNDKVVSGPLRIYPIDGSYFISAILDTTLNEKIVLNSEILKINGEDIQTLFERFKNNDFGSNVYIERESLLLQEFSKTIIQSKVGSMVSMVFKTPDGDIEEVQMIYKNKYAIPRNFFSPHCEFKKLNNHIGYYKVNTFDELPALRFQSIVDSISNLDLIIDLRGNGGGDIAFLDDLLSFFIPSNSYSLINAKLKNGDLEDSLIFFNTNSHKMSKESKVIILIDHNTACSSEIFIQSMKKYRPETLTVGTENTHGALAVGYNIIPPDNSYYLTVNAPGIYKCKYDIQIEGVGIPPDITVKINKIQDLKPYDDKVLNEAIKACNNQWLLKGK